MAKKKKLTRKELLKQPDEFITTTGKLIQFAQTYRKLILYTVCAICIVLLAFTSVRYYLATMEKRAFARLDQALSNYEMSLNNKGIRQAYADVKTDFETILKKYSNRNGGKLARLTFANICNKAGDYDRAIDLLDQSQKDFNTDPFYQKMILSSLAHAYQGKNETEAAITFFEQITETPGDYLKDEAYFHLGQLYQRAGNTEKARTALKTLISQYQQSMYVQMVKEQIDG